MLRASVISFMLALVAIASGMAGTAGISFELGRFLFLTLLLIAVVTFIWALLRQRPAVARARNDRIPP